MSTYLPPMRLMGAQILRNGQFQRRSLAVARGRITKGPLPEVDLSGYLVLPGIVDLHCALPSLPRPQDLPRLDERLASHGVTTAWLAMEAQPSRMEGVLAALGRRRGGSDLRAKLVLAPEPGPDPDLLRLLEAQGLDFAVFQSQPHRDGDSAAALFSRDLCRLAETFDALGILYGSLGDVDAETREYYRMLGARIAEQPRTRAAAATAKAMNDAVLAPAGDLLPQARMREAVNTARLVAEGLCDGLISGGMPATLPDAAWMLASGAINALPATWDLVSRKPAEIMGLTDRGTLDHGKRADIVVMNPATRRVEATIAAGQLTFATGMAAQRLLQKLPANSLAAE
ncbi:amidohydrolase family protein [Nioella nitratireducens]|uniref:hypothetical protein n=1 Tax=Nioella nitratireducens TaxID=1287720 RepID=UPI0008FD8CBC|nr:hypothetical protein [Nioella nitratireducens]